MQLPEKSLFCRPVAWTMGPLFEQLILAHSKGEDVLKIQSCRGEQGRDPGAGRAFVLEVVDEAASSTLVAPLPLLDRLLAEKVVEVRERRMEAMVDFMAARMQTPSTVQLEMARRLAQRHAKVLNEFGHFTAEQLADAAGSQAGKRSALADNWLERRQVFAVPHPNRGARERDVYPAFHFEGGRTIKAVQEVLEAFAGRKSPWKIAMWFTSSDGGLAQSARPVDLLTSHPEQVVRSQTRCRGERCLSCRVPGPPLHPCSTSGRRRR